MIIANFIKLHNNPQNPTNYFVLFSVVLQSISVLFGHQIFWYKQTKLLDFINHIHLQPPCLFPRHSSAVSYPLVVIIEVERFSKQIIENYIFQILKNSFSGCLCIVHLIVVMYQFIQAYVIPDLTMSAQSAWPSDLLWSYQNAAPSFLKNSASQSRFQRVLHISLTVFLAFVKFAAHFSDHSQDLFFLMSALTVWTVAFKFAQTLKADIQNCGNEELKEISLQLLPKQHEAGMSSETLTGVRVILGKLEWTQVNQQYLVIKEMLRRFNEICSHSITLFLGASVLYFSISLDSIFANANMLLTTTFTMNSISYMLFADTAKQVKIITCSICKNTGNLKINIHINFLPKCNINF